jgi:pyrroloquinoline quinone biosynthesis protein B
MEEIMMMTNRMTLILILLVFSVSILCAQSEKKSDQLLTVLGSAQDAGYPQIGCERADCVAAQKDRNLRKLVVSLGLVDKSTKQKWLFEATPDIGEQLFELNKFLPSKSMMPDGIFLTHAHIGHYAGLMYLGREAVGAKAVPVYAMPRMERFLNENAPWSQLVSLKNIAVNSIEADKSISVSKNLSIKPFLVPHRDEFSETVGFEIKSSKRTVVFIPDIDKWSKWDMDLREVVKKSDYVLIDATFYKNGEIPNRDMSEIPHPFVEETMKLLEDLPKSERNRVYFIHFNHTNPLINLNSKESKSVLKKGFHIAYAGLVLGL